MKIVSLDPKICKKWQFADRSAFEFHKTYELGEDIKRNGQIEPAIVRPITDSEYQYEVIAGARRWKACYDAEIPLKAIISEMTDDEAAIAQIKENQKLAICDYSKGMFYSKILESKKISQTKLEANIQLSKAKLKDFLAFAKIDHKIWNAVGDTSKVSSRTAREIHSLSLKGKKYVDALIELNEEIRNGIGATSLRKAVDAIVMGEPLRLDNEKSITLPSGTVIATWTNNHLRFSENINFNQKDLEKTLINFFEKA